MPRVSAVAFVVCSVVLPCFAFGQTPTIPPGGRSAPGAVPGAQRPGLPPRDNPAEPQTGTAHLRGRVVAVQTGQPLRRAVVSLSGADGSSLRRSATTDGEGRYEFQDLPAGRFTVTAGKAGYVSLQYGQRRPFEGGTPLSLADGQTQEKIDFALPRGSVIVVRILDEFNEPVAGAQLQVQRYEYGPDGQRRLVQAPSGLPGFAMTDDLGVIRAYGLMPGEYVLQATARSGGLSVAGNANDRGEGFSPTYYPGTISAAEAQPVTVGVGEEISVQFSMAAARLARVSGTVVDSEGRPAAGAELSLSTRAGNTVSMSRAGQVSPDGSFTIAGVSPGEHTLEVRPSGRGATGGEFGETPIVVTGDLNDVRITTTRGATVTGRVVFEGTAPRTGASGALRVTTGAVGQARVLTAPGTSLDPLTNGTVDEAGNFQIAGVSGRVFFNTLNTPPAWMVKSVSLDGEDITDTPFDLTSRTSVTGLRVTLTDKMTTVSGHVNDGRGQALRDYVVVIQPSEPKDAAIQSRWIRVARPDNTGRFEARGMRPGRYVATAVEALEQGRQFAPEFQSRLRETGRSFSVDEGGTATLSLDLTTGL